ncbi:hypothetical protein [Leptothoe sp. PORK10 BA2]|uniref:hypothetical protein n=1 Tax=Leptothoe sp. PORK10 BA2 TaxID=3110254 RepID=UPI002B2004B6|nr:hypothetical protein [Leptothoe sp. PORK10 BA2]MEA5464231.1 hypothetical protein [Leptothoe sp. PORK10 BA2]
MKQKIGKHRLKLGNQFVGSLTPFEDALHLAALLRIELRGRQVGAYVLAKGKNREHLCFVFGFDCKGIHNTLTDEQVETGFSQLESGLKDLPGNERLTLHPTIPNSERVCVVSDDEVSSIELDLNEKSMVSDVFKLEFRTAVIFNLCLYPALDWLSPANHPLKSAPLRLTVPERSAGTQGSHATHTESRFSS